MRQQVRGTVNEAILEDLMVRFLYNLTEAEVVQAEVAIIHIIRFQKTCLTRVCNRLEQAHWFYIDNYCSKEADAEMLESGEEPCVKVGWKDFVRQVFRKCHFLKPWSGRIDAVSSSGMG